MNILGLKNNLDFLIIRWMNVMGLRNTIDLLIIGWYENSWGTMFSQSLLKVDSYGD